MPTRSDYVTMIWMYEKRRKELKQVTSKRLKRMREKIYACKSMVKDIDERNIAVFELIKATNYFFNVDISSPSKSTKVVLARYCYYKLGLESDIPNLDGTHLAEAIGREKKEAYRRRIDLTRSFRINKHNKDAYHSFEKYMQENKNGL